jgi:hypothetical protein
MKKITQLIALITVSLFNSCQDVVEVDLNKTTPKLVIEASINWYKGTSGNEQKIKLTTTADFYGNVIPVVSGATIFIKNSSNIIFNFIEKPNTGEYICTDFIPIRNETYTLTITSNGKTYTATETLKPVTPITKIVQNNEGGFNGKTITLKTFFNDSAEEENYYLYKYVYSDNIKFNYYVDEDKFFQGNEFFSISQYDDLKTADKVDITHYGISKTYYNYMRILVSIAGNSGGSPFQSPPATVRGNIINNTNFDDFALGYFSLSEVDTRNYSVQ